MKLFGVVSTLFYTLVVTSAARNHQISGCILPKIAHNLYVHWSTQALVPPGYFLPMGEKVFVVCDEARLPRATRTTLIGCDNMHELPKCKKDGCNIPCTNFMEYKWCNKYIPEGESEIVRSDEKDYEYKITCVNGKLEGLDEMTDKKACHLPKSMLDKNIRMYTYDSVETGSYHGDYSNIMCPRNHTAKSYAAHLICNDGELRFLEVFRTKSGRTRNHHCVTADACVPNEQ